LIKGHNIFWNAIANLSATIFDNGKRSHEVDFARAFHEELVETYVRVLYTAIRETEDAIAAIQHNGKRLDAQRSATDAARHAWELSMESYAAGAIDYLTLLDTQRTYHRNLDELHRVDMERHKGLVALFGALGGGVPKGGVLPGDGRRPVAEANGKAKADAALASDQVAEKTDIQQYDPHPGDGEEYWLAEVVGLQDRSGIAHVWRDLNKRFPDLMAGRTLAPRAQGYVANEQQMRTAWYRIFVASFPSSAAAETFCGQLMEQLQRCRPVSSLSEAFREVKQLPSLPYDPPRLSELIPPITRTADNGDQAQAGVQVMPVSAPAVPADRR
ncbi:partial Toluene efflux pump outer membrane protein TtgI, partial [Rhodocyclaceae bacterium]